MTMNYAEKNSTCNGIIRNSLGVCNGIFFKQPFCGRIFIANYDDWLLEIESNEINRSLVPENPC